MNGRLFRDQLLVVNTDVQNVKFQKLKKKFRYRNF